MPSTPSPDDPEINPDELPFVALCRRVALGAPLRWLRLGWQDLRRAPGPSLSYGVAVLVISYGISAIAWHYGSIYLLLAVLIVTVVLLGFVTGLLGLALGMPVIGHGTWHAYQETIDASAWPRNEPVV